MAVDSKYKQKYNFSDGTDLFDVIKTGLIDASDAGVMHLSGNETVTGQKTFTQDIIGTAVKAKYADLAEIYKTDAIYSPGTLIQWGGSEQITIATSDVNGVISDNPAFLINSDSEGLPVALAGQVKILITGKVDKFDIITLSNIPGVGVRSESINDKMIARALESSDSDGIKLVLCVTSFTI